MFAKIALDFPDDPKVINAGFIAELVYVRCTLYAKAARTDGVINRARLKRWLAGIPGKPDKHMAALVAVGLVEIHDEGWNIPLKVWCRWNKTADEIAEESQTKSTAGTKGNHVKHHVEKGVTHPGCRWCLAEPSHSASKVLAEPSQTPRTSSLEVETETEVETDSLSSSNGSSSVATNPTRREQIIAEHVRIAKALANDRGHTIRDDKAWTGAIVTRVSADPNLERWSAMFPTAPADAIAAWLHGDKGSQQYYPTADELAAAEDGPEIADVIEMRWA